MKPHTIKMLNISRTILMSVGGKASQGANLSSTAKGNEAVSAIRWLTSVRAPKRFTCFALIRKIKNNKKKEGDGGHVTKRTAQSHLAGSNYGSGCRIDFSAEHFFDFYREFSLKIDEKIYPY